MEISRGERGLHRGVIARFCYCGVYNANKCILDFEIQIEALSRSVPRCVLSFEIELF